MGDAPDEFTNPNHDTIQPADLDAAAKDLLCDVAAIEAVSEVESGKSGFLPDNRPTILFESHAFHKYTGGKFDADYPDISTPSWERNYGAAGAHQYDRLHQAIALDRSAALQSASWGRYQIMGGNFNQAGYDNVEAFVADMVANESYHLDAFVAFLQNGGIDGYLRLHKWQEFALLYNGPGQVGFYSAKINNAYYAIQVADAHRKASNA